MSCFLSNSIFAAHELRGKKGHDLRLALVFLKEAKNLDGFPFLPLDISEKREIFLLDDHGKISGFGLQKQQAPAFSNAGADKTHSRQPPDMIPDLLTG